MGPPEEVRKQSRVGHSAAWWTMIVLLALCPFGIPNMVRPWFNFYIFRSIGLPCFFDMMWWVVMTSCALLAGLSVISRGETTDRRKVTTVAWICCGAQLFGILASYAPPSKFDSAVSGLKALALGCGVCGAWTAALSLFPMSRCSPMLVALGVPVDAALAWHAVCGRLTVAFLTSHVSLFVISWSVKGGAKMVWDELTEMKTDDINNLFGVCAWLCLLSLLFAMSLSRVRRTRYEWFYGFHLAGLVGFASFASMHWFYFPYYLSPAIVFWTVDLVARYRNSSRVLNVEAQAWYDASLIRLRFSSRDKVEDESICCFPTREGAVYASICVHAISRRQYHPFTLVPFKDGWECWIRARGDWTGALLAVVKDSPSPLLQARLTTVSSTGWPLSTTTRTILVAGGTGIVPFLGIARHRNVTHLIWAIRHVDDLSMLLSSDAWNRVLEDDLENPTELVVFFTGDAARLEAVREKLAQVEPSHDRPHPFSGTRKKLKTLGYLHAAAAFGMVFGTVLAVVASILASSAALWQLSLLTLSSMVFFAAAFTALALSCLSKQTKKTHQPLPSAAEALNPVYEMTTTVPTVSTLDEDNIPSPPAQAVAPSWSSATVIAGRPDLEKYLGGEDISVMASGPHNLVVSTRRACVQARALSKNKITFTPISYDISDL